eukprot:22000-Rhodomonas_salina.1
MAAHGAICLRACCARYPVTDPQSLRNFLRVCFAMCETARQSALRCEGHSASAARVIARRSGARRSGVLSERREGRAGREACRWAAQGGALR